MTTEMKPLEWVESFKGLSWLAVSAKGIYLITHRSGHIIWRDGSSNTIVPGPYDGTIETAKKRCEEHRRKVSQ